MRSPKDMDIIQIDITNACVHMCSNCTRFCGHHKSNFFMDFETFRQAVDSLEGYEGMVGIIGGEPTIHPDFERFADYIREKRVKEHVAAIRQPIEDMAQYILDNMWHADAKAGLWSSLNSGYYKHFEVINDTFKTQLLNDHDNACLHQALLMPRKELGISDEEWIQKRDACWIQNTWSATITPKGAFFCEVAGSLDMLFDGPGGWKVEPGWWKRSPEEFGEQLHWCELCSACLDVPKRISNDGRDDITPMMLEKLRDIGSLKVQRGMYAVHDPKDYDKNKYKTFTGSNDYMEAGGNKRTSKDNRNLYPKRITFVSWDKLPETICSTQSLDWLAVSDDMEEARNAEEYGRDVILNPGCIYYYGETALFHPKARALRNVDWSRGAWKENLWKLYERDKIILLNLKEIRSRKWLSEKLRGVEKPRVAVYGAGVAGKKLFSYLLGNKEVSLCGWFDKNYECLGYPVQSPENLVNTVYDFLLVATRSKAIFDDIAGELGKLNMPAGKVIWVSKF